MKFILALILSTQLISHPTQAMGRGRVSIPTVTPTPAPTGTIPIPLVGAPSCVSSDPNHICIGLKLVSYTSNGTAVLTQAQAITLVNGMNTNWKNDGDAVRGTFNDGGSFLVVTVGSLTGSTIGVTEMPGAGVYGSLITSSYAQNDLTVGHELGHYQGLYHVSDNTNLMNPYIGSNTSALTASQCSTARATDQSTWTKMLRN